MPELALAMLHVCSVGIENSTNFERCSIQQYNTQGHFDEATIMTYVYTLIIAATDQKLAVYLYSYYYHG